MVMKKVSPRSSHIPREDNFLADAMLRGIVNLKKGLLPQRTCDSLFQWYEIPHMGLFARRENVKLPTFSH